MKESAFAHHYRAQAFRTLRYGKVVRTDRPFFRVLNSIPGFTYVGIGPVAIWRDGWRFGIGGR